MEGVGGIDAELSEGGGQVACAVATAEGGVTRLVWVEWCWQWGGKVQAGQVRQGTARIHCRRDMRGIGLLVW